MCHGIYTFSLSDSREITHSSCLKAIYACTDQLSNRLKEYSNTSSLGIIDFHIPIVKENKGHAADSDKAQT